MPKESKVSRPKSLSKKWLYAVILVIVILACAAVYMTSYYASHNNAVVMGNSSSTQGTTQPPIDTNTQQPMDGQTFKIPELGIQMTLPVGLEGLEYKVDKSFGNPMVGFGTKELNAKNDSQSYCNTSNAPLGSMVMYSEDPRAHAQAPGPSSVTVLQGRYFAYFHPQSGCTADEELGRLQDQQIQLFQVAIKSMSISQ